MPASHTDNPPSACDDHDITSPDDGVTTEQEDEAKRQGLQTKVGLRRLRRFRGTVTNHGPEKHEERVVENDYLVGQQVTLKKDGYNLAVGAHLSNQVSPQALNYSLVKSFMIFLIQNLIALGYFYDFRLLNNF